MSDLTGFRVAVVATDGFEAPRWHSGSASSTARWVTEPVQAATDRTPRARRSGPGFASGQWLWGDGSLAAITRIITDGAANPKEYRGVMPPMGGAELSPSEVAAVAAYVWALGHQSEG